MTPGFTPFCPTRRDVEQHWSRFARLLDALGQHANLRSVSETVAATDALAIASPRSDHSGQIS